MIIDSHMHINSSINVDIQESISKINSNPEIESVINVGLDIDTSVDTINIARNNNKFYSSVGIHPLYVNGQSMLSLISIIQNEKVIAIGEIGLDKSKSNYEEQKIMFIKQIMLANEFHLPVIIHSNNSNYDVIEIFEKYVKPQYGCVFHMFQPDLEVLKYLEYNGYYVSFGGKITYKNAKKSLEVAKEVDKDLFLVETDSPYIAPEPFKEHPNETSNIIYVIKRLSEVREVSYEDIVKQTNENTKRLFKKLR